MNLRTRIIRPGTHLYNGTNVEFDEATEMQFPAWFSEKPRVARWFVNWHGEPEALPYGKKAGEHARIAQFRVAGPLRLISIHDSRQFDEFKELAYADDPDSLAEWACSNGYDGWIIWNNYPDEGGSDIMLCSGDNLQHVSSEPVQDGSYGVTDIDRILNEILDAGEFPEPPRGPGSQRMGWKPVNFGQEASKPVQINTKPTPASRFSHLPPANEPPMRYMSNQDVEAIMQRIRDEEALPPHQQNSARISALKQQALEMMRRLESVRLQRRANELLPKLES